jgi:multisubunit Na+/H+ antiporter MnhG subunit
MLIFLCVCFQDNFFYVQNGGLLIFSFFFNSAASNMIIRALCKGEVLQLDPLFYSQPMSAVQCF